ncbi:MAG: hypothetical protein Aurels2KO_11020 [Aureliella sp.]
MLLSQRFRRLWGFSGAFCVFVLSLLAQIAAANEPAGMASVEFEVARKWTNAWDVSMDATLVSLHGGSVALKTESGTFVVPLATLSDDDVAYVESALAKIGRDSFFPGQATPDGTEKSRQQSGDWRRVLESWAEIVVEGGVIESEAAWNRIRNISDLAALDALLKMVDEAKDAAVAVACVEAIASLKSKEAIRELVRLSIEDERYPVANTAAWMIKSTGTSDAMLDEFERLLKANPERAMMTVFVADVADPRRIPLSSCSTRHSGFTKSLIALLTVKQSKPAWIGKFKVQWGRVGTTGVHLHRRASTVPTRVFFEVAHPTALQLLKQYTNEDYGYNKRDWYRWERETVEKSVE